MAPRSFRRMLAISAVTALGVLTPVPVQAAEDVPVLGQTGYVPAEADAEHPTILSVHGVRRAEEGTVIYFSAALPEDAPAGHRLMLDVSVPYMAQGDVAPPEAGISLLDTRTQTAHVPLRHEGNCVCSKTVPLDPEPGVAYVGHTVVPPLPAETTTVNVFIGNQLVPDVPVEDGLLEPTVEDEGEPLILGMGWPTVDLEAAGTADPEPALRAFKHTTSNVEQSVTSRGADVDLDANVLFEVDSADLTSKGRTAVKEAAKTLQDAGASGTIAVTGHTDSDGSDSHNQDLSERRAASVVKALEPLVGDDVTLQAEGRGESEPVGDNSTSAGKAENRRVTIELEEKK